ncbi:hypothetical protein ABW21_db0203848 [Orbilia brochopaga]|nr:hypothetical protein ABW21_db0203848 [Drechslerella brochopaga]
MATLLKIARGRALQTPIHQMNRRLRLHTELRQPHMAELKTLESKLGALEKRFNSMEKKFQEGIDSISSDVAILEGQFQSLDMSVKFILVGTMVGIHWVGVQIPFLLIDQ